MTTTTTTTTSTPAAVKPKRPAILIAAAVLMLLAAVLSLATPFLPRGGFGGGAGPGGAPRLSGQAPGDPGQDPASGQAPTGGGGQPPANASGFGAGGPGGLGFGSGQTGGTFSVMSLMQPLRIGEALLGALFALLAALGLWRLRTWGRNLALVVAAACLLGVVAGFASSLVGRNAPWLMILGGSTWQAILGFGLALAASILALLPAARRACIVKPRERRVM